MNVRNCSRCGKMYRYDGFRICPTCRKGDEEDFKVVKEYLYENPGASIPEVEEATGVDSKKIIEFLRAGRLEIGEDSAITLECESCGVTIRTGRFCSKCTSSLEREFNQAKGSSTGDSSSKEYASKDSRKKEEKFRVIDRYDKRR